jgi:hypothetical protein
MSAATHEHEVPVAGTRRASTRARWWTQVIVIAWLAWIYDITTNLAPLRRAAALSHATGILNLERSLHLDPELSLNRWMAGHHTLALLASDWYDNAHFIVTFVLLGWLWWRRTDLYRPLRNTLVLINLIGFAVFLLFPVAPPRMLAGAGFSDLVATTHAFGGWHTGSLAQDANQYAAMPSLHMAWAAWCALAMWRLGGARRVRWLVWLYPLVTGIVVLCTGNHFLLDVLSGLLVAALAVALDVLWPHRWRSVRLRRTALPSATQHVH